MKNKKCMINSFVIIILAIVSMIIFISFLLNSSNKLKFGIKGAQSCESIAGITGQDYKCVTKSDCTEEFGGQIKSNHECIEENNKGKICCLYS